MFTVHVLKAPCVLFLFGGNIWSLQNETTAYTTFLHQVYFTRWKHVPIDITIAATVIRHELF